MGVMRIMSGVSVFGMVSHCDRFPWNELFRVA
jgi:hypothetical protein